HHDAVLGILTACHPIGIGGKIARLARAPAGAEIESVIAPQAPHWHHVRAAIGTHGDHPILSALAEAVFSPFPRQHALLGGRDSIARHVGTGGSRFPAATGDFLGHSRNLSSLPSEHFYPKPAKGRCV